MAVVSPTTGLPPAQAGPHLPPNTNTVTHTTNFTHVRSCPRVEVLGRQRSNIYGGSEVVSHNPHSRPPPPPPPPGYPHYSQHPPGNYYTHPSPTTPNTASPTHYRPHMSSPHIPSPPHSGTLHEYKKTLPSIGNMVPPMSLPPPLIDSNSSDSGASNQNKFPPPPGRRRTIIHMSPHVNTAPNSRNNSISRTNSMSRSNSISAMSSPGLPPLNQHQQVFSDSSDEDKKTAEAHEQQHHHQQHQHSEQPKRKLSSLDPLEEESPMMNPTHNSHVTHMPGHVNKKPRPDKELKKSARKTAHSAIERRRRSKMNEEFDSLKQLVPACRQSIAAEGGDAGLHKLTILQATVEYVRYLQACLDSVENGQQIYLNGPELPGKKAQGSMSYSGGSNPPSNLCSPASSISGTPMMLPVGSMSPLDRFSFGTPQISGQSGSTPSMTPSMTPNMGPTATSFALPESAIKIEDTKSFEASRTLLMLGQKDKEKDRGFLKVSDLLS